MPSPAHDAGHSTTDADRGPGAITWVPALVFLAGAVLRIVNLDTQSFWFDEAFSWDRSTLPFPQMIAELVADFNKPPLHYFILRGWLDVAGSSSSAARALAALFGIATLPSLYWLGYELYDRTTAIFATTLLAISELAIAYSQEVRPYSQLMLFTVLFAALYLRAVRLRSAVAWTGATLCATLALWTHYYAVLTLAAVMVWHLVYARGSVPLRWVVLMVVLSCGSLVPWLLMDVIDVTLKPNEIMNSNQPSYFSVGWDTLLENLVAFGNGRVENVVAPARAPWAVTLSSALFCAPALAMLRRRRKHGWLGSAFIIALGSFTATWKWVVLAIALVVAGELIARIGNHRLRWLATSAYVVAVAATAGLAQIQYVPYFMSFLLGVLLVLPFRPWLPDLTAPGDDRKRALLLVLMVVVPLATLLLAGAAGVQYNVRYALAALAPFYLLVARSIALLRSRRLLAAWVAAILAFSTVGIHTALAVPSKENYRDALALLHESYRPGDCVTFVPTGTVPLQWHLYRYDDVPLRSLKEAEADRPEAECRDVWLVIYERVIRTADRGRAVEAQLSSRRDVLAERQFHWIRVVRLGPLKG
jgi:uncharacterized membrane protein